MDVDLGELYAGPWQDFVARRGHLVAAARAAGDRAAAQQLQQLKKPTRGAWLVNLIAHHERDRLAEVLELGESLARAHRDADPAELRRLSALRTAVVDSLAGRASALGAERGYAAPDSVRQEVAETIQAALADPQLADRVLTGQLATTVRAAAFGPADLFAPAAPMAQVIPLRREAAAEPEPAGADPAEVRRASRDLGRAEARWDEARERLQRADAALAEAVAAQTEQAELAAELDTRLAEVQRQLARLEAEAAGARDRLTELVRGVDDRQAARDRATRETTEAAELITQLQEQLRELGIEP
ncbi:MAG: hypothetical protein Q4F67_03995 [Propionibacteriaceae bacterium]|nr:hypothetical protein [Propionibacteriaceae bacterium]